MKSSIGNALVQTREILERAIDDHNPRYVYIAYSGGRDSAIVMDVASRLLSNRGDTHLRVMSIDTGLSFDGWVDMIRGHVEHYDLKLDIVKGRGWSWYAQNVREYGFGYTPGAHTFYYRALKQDAIQSHLQDVKKKWRDRVLYLTGVRRAESPKRRSTRDVIRHGSRVTVNCIAHWGDGDCSKYHRVLLNHYYNPSYERYGSSGDCFCGWTCSNNVDDFKDTSPMLYNRLSALSNEQVELGMHPYGTRGDTLDHSGGTMPDDSLCVNCASNAQ